MNTVCLQWSQFKVNTPVIDEITGQENTKGVETINNRAKILTNS